MLLDGYNVRCDHTKMRQYYLKYRRILTRTPWPAAGTVFSVCRCQARSRANVSHKYIIRRRESGSRRRDLRQVVTTLGATFRTVRFESQVGNVKRPLRFSCKHFAELEVFYSGVCVARVATQKHTATVLRNTAHTIYS